MNKNIKNKINLNNISSNRNFGIVFSFFFFLLFIYFLMAKNITNYYFILCSLFFLILGLLNSKLLTPLNQLWFKIGIILGKIISPIVMALIFFGIVTPISLFLRFIKKDILDLKLNTKSKSYWIENKEPIGNMKDQF